MSALACPLCGSPGELHHGVRNIRCSKFECALNQILMRTEEWQTRADHSGELVQALEDISDISSRFLGDPIHALVIEQARAAIAKATGKGTQ